MTTVAMQGAYGLRIDGIDRTDLLNAGVPASWPVVQIEYQTGRSDLAVSITDSLASFPCGESGAVVADRAAGTVTVCAPQPVTDDEMTHPYLAWIAAAWARWLDREAFHAGGIVVDGGVWGVTGDRGSGKSTLLARCELGGVGVVADDLLVVDGQTAYAGPRCVDLRDESAAYLGVGTPLVTEGRERHRVALGAVAVELPFRGWVMLAWGDAHELVPLRPTESLVRLGAQRMAQLHEVRPGGLLDHAALPVWELRRPRHLAGLDTSLALLTGLHGGDA